MITFFITLSVLDENKTRITKSNLINKTDLKKFEFKEINLEIEMV